MAPASKGTLLNIHYYYYYHTPNPLVEKRTGGSRSATSKNLFIINTLMQNGLKSTYIDETHIDLGPLTLWYEQLF